MGRIVIACYRPKPGKVKALHDLVRTHVQRLREQGLVTDRAPVMMEAKDGTVLEVFEWTCQDAIDRAHANPAVQAMWAEFSEVCEHVPVGTVAESRELFSGFEPLPPS